MTEYIVIVQQRVKVGARNKTEACKMIKRTPPFVNWFSLTSDRMVRSIGGTKILSITERRGHK